MQIFEGTDLEIALSRFLNRGDIFQPNHLPTVQYVESRAELARCILDIISKKSPHETSELITSILLNALEGTHASEIRDLIGKIS